MLAGLKEYWKRKGISYRRLNGSGRRRKNPVVELGGGTRRRWRIKISPRKVRIPKIRFSPKKMVLWLRDAYVKMMMSLANSRMVGLSASTSGYSFGGGFGRGPTPKEYDDKMLIHMYRSLMMAQLVPPEIACPRWKYFMSTCLFGHNKLVKVVLFYWLLGIWSIVFNSNFVHAHLI